MLAFSASVSPPEIGGRLLARNPPGVVPGWAELFWTVWGCAMTSPHDPWLAPTPRRETMTG